MSFDQAVDSPPNLEPASETEPYPPVPRDVLTGRNRNRRRLYIAVVTIFVVLVVALAAYEFSLHNFSFTMVSKSFDPSTREWVAQNNLSLPSGSSVTGRWWQVSNPNGASGPENLTVQSPFGTVVYSASGTSGSFAFKSGAPYCLFETAAAEGVSTAVSGNYTSPIL